MESLWRGALRSREQGTKDSSCVVYGYMGWGTESAPSDMTERSVHLVAENIRAAVMLLDREESGSSHVGNSSVIEDIA